MLFSEKRASKMFRCWNGYGLIFAGRKLKLDDNMFPIFKPRKMNKNEKFLVHKNLQHLSKNMHIDLFWLFCFANNVSSATGTKYALSLNTTSVAVDRACANYESYIASDHLGIYNNFVANSNDMEMQAFADRDNYTKLIRLVVENRISLVTLMQYHTRIAHVNIDDLDDNMLYQSYIKKVVKACIYLEEKYNFSSRVVEVSLEYRRKLKL